MAGARKGAAGLRVFVYGTLMPGEVNHRTYCELFHPRVTIASVRGRLFRLPAGYPALVPGELWIEGRLLEFENGSVLSVLDELEDYQPSRPSSDNEYDREEVAIFNPAGEALGVAWTYRMTEEKARRFQGVPIDGTSWGSAWVC
jgi:gamma-glutamylcyclotransferase (GGCT)/AIG2-like uncharacterized protein YtfP